MLDMDVVENTLKFNTFSKTALMTTMKSKTELDNPNKVQQINGWL